jgi:uncharacterized membrane-anchored protein YhcB (DUF1043 family)
MWYFAIGFICGLTVGVIGIALLNSAKEADERMERFMDSLETFEVPCNKKEDENVTSR